MKFDGVFGEEVKGVREKGLGAKETKKMARGKREKDEIWEGVSRKNMNQLEVSNLMLLTLLPARFGRFDKYQMPDLSGQQQPCTCSINLYARFLFNSTLYPKCIVLFNVRLVFRYVSFIYCGSGAVKDKSMLMVPFPIAPLPDLHLEPRT